MHSKSLRWIIGSAVVLALSVGLNLLPIDAQSPVIGLQTSGGSVSSITATGASLTVTNGAGPTANIDINVGHTNVFTVTQTAPTWKMSNSGTITDDFTSIYFTTGSGGATRQSGSNWQLTSGGVYQITSGTLFAGVDTGLSRGAAGIISIGNGTAADFSGGVKTTLHVGPATAPSGTCTAAQGGGWEFTQDGHATFCPVGGGTWVSKI